MYRKQIIFFIILTLLISVFPVGCISSENTPESIAQRYLKYLTEKQYDKMFFLLSSNSMTKIKKDEFVEKYSSIFDAMEVNSIHIKKYPFQYGIDISTLPYEATFDTEKCGKLKFTYYLDVTQSNDEWTIEWTPALIFPQMQWNDRAIASRVNPVRGEIFDANSEVLAGNKAGITAYAKLSDIKDVDTFAAQAAPVLDMTKEKIVNIIDASRKAGIQLASFKSYLPDSLTPEQEQAILSIEGMGIDKKNLSSFRYYKFKGSFAHLIGYVGKITKDDIDKNKLDGYDQVGVVGRTGLEKAYDKQLRGKSGWEIFIVDETGKRRATIFRNPAENGQDLVLTIDAQLQLRTNELMEQYFNTTCSGAVVVTDPVTGAVKTAASWPTFDPNIFNLPVPKETIQYYNSKEAKAPLVNRFTQALLPPGSTFKPFTAIMGLDSEIITPDFEFKGEINNNVWLPDPKIKSWKIRRIPFGSGPLNLTRALVWSDNIYFAYVALELKFEKFINYCTKFGLKEAPPFELSVARPQISNTNNIVSKASLADSGYGQGEILVTPLQLSTMYGLFGNSGTIMKPYVVDSLNNTVNGRHVPTSETIPAIWKADLASTSIVNTIDNILVEVVDDGSGDKSKVPDMKIAGKTGTAQMGSQERAIGWYVGYIMEGGKKYIVTVCADGKTDDVKAKFDVAKGVFEKLKYDPEEATNNLN